VTGNGLPPLQHALQSGFLLIETKQREGEQRREENDEEERDGSLRRRRTKSREEGKRQL
jgi:hypothetical protein